MLRLNELSSSEIFKRPFTYITYLRAYTVDDIVISSKKNDIDGFEIYNYRLLQNEYTGR